MKTTLKILLFTLAISTALAISVIAQPVTSNHKQVDQDGKVISMGSSIPKVDHKPIYLPLSTNQRLVEIEKQVFNLRDSVWRKKEEGRLADLYNVTLSTLYEANKIDQSKIVHWQRNKQNNPDSLILTIQK